MPLFCPRRLTPKCGKPRWIICKNPLTLLPTTLDARRTLPKSWGLYPVRDPDPCFPRLSFATILSTPEALLLEDSSLESPGPEITQCWPHARLTATTPPQRHSRAPHHRHAGLGRAITSITQSLPSSRWDGALSPRLSRCASVDELVFLACRLCLNLEI